MTHRIRLRSGWETTRTEDGRTLLVRRFGRPRTLEVQDRVWLVWGSTAGDVDLWLNGQHLDIATTATRPEVELTSRLQPRNELRMIGPVSVESLGDIALEIRSESRTLAGVEHTHRG